MIIDCHCHAGKGDGLTGPWDTSAPLEHYLRRAAEAGIERTVRLPRFTRIMQWQTVRWGGLWRASASLRRVCLLSIPSETAAGWQRWCKRQWVATVFVDEVHRYDARITREICEVARSFSLPVLYDIMGEVSVVELLATEYTDVVFIIPHLGSFADDWRAQLALIDHLVRHPNIFTDTSGIRRFDLLEQASGERALTRSSSAPTVRGCTREWRWPRCGYWG